MQAAPRRGVGGAQLDECHHPTKIIGDRPVEGVDDRPARLAYRHSRIQAGTHQLERLRCLQDQLLSASSGGPRRQPAEADGSEHSDDRPGEPEQPIRARAAFDSGRRRRRAAPHPLSISRRVAGIASTRPRISSAPLDGGPVPCGCADRPINRSPGCCTSRYAATAARPAQISAAGDAISRSRPRNLDHRTTPTYVAA